MLPEPITFRSLGASDLPMLAEWMEQPHWREWWGDPETEIGFIRNMLDGTDSTEPYLFFLDGLPAGYIQCWHIADARVDPWLTEAPWIMDLPDDAVGVDLSLADPALLSKGIGTATLTAFVARLRASGHNFIIIDPDATNIRAVRAYEKSGFRPIESLQGRTGDCLIMRHCTKDDTL